MMGVNVIKDTFYSDTLSQNIIRIITARKGEWAEHMEHMRARKKAHA